jgi:hypothetical protein
MYVYAIEGESQQTITEFEMESPWILMPGERPGNNYVCRGDGEWIEETPIIIPPSPSVTASAKLTIQSGVMEGFAADSQIAGGFQLDIGKFMLFFDTPITSPYIVSAFDGGLYRIYVDAEDYEDDYFTVTCTDLSGTLSDPSNMSVLIITT